MIISLDAKKPFFFFSEIVAFIRYGPFGLRKPSLSGNEPLCLSGNANLGRLEVFISVCQILWLQEMGHLFFLTFQGKPLKVTPVGNTAVSGVAHTCGRLQYKNYTIIKRRTKLE